MNKKVIIVGAGPAGLGVAIALKNMGISATVLERDDIGSSFLHWPKEMRLISPSFTGNFFGMPDLNAITPDTSPAYTLHTEHPTGKEYAHYLSLIAKQEDITVEKNCEVTRIKKPGRTFHIETNKGTYKTTNLIWATGEYRQPNDTPFDGAEHCIHNSSIKSWSDLKGDAFAVIGGYESGIDAAHQLARLGKKVIVLDGSDTMSVNRSDSSYALSPYTRDQFAEQQDNIRIAKNTRVHSVSKKDGSYVMHLGDNNTLGSKTQPILATGFSPQLGLVDDMFEKADDYPLLTDNDESTTTPGLFLVGPKVRHGADIFCFIYKYRQRFAVVAKTIAHRSGHTAQADQAVEIYKKHHFYLDDLSCCGNECPC